MRIGSKIDDFEEFRKTLENDETSKSSQKETSEEESSSEEDDETDEKLPSLTL